MKWKMSSPLLFLSRKLGPLRKWECVLGNGGALTLSDVQIKGKERQLPRVRMRVGMHLRCIELGDNGCAFELQHTHLVSK